MDRARHATPAASRQQPAPDAHRVAPGRTSRVQLRTSPAPAIQRKGSGGGDIHQVAAAANVPGLENVAHLARRPATGAWVIALPMKIAGGSGGPTRVIAVVPDS